MKPWHEGGFWAHVKSGGKSALDWFKGATADSPSKRAQRANLDYQGSEASGFANEGQDAYTAGRAEQIAARQQLADQASGKISLSGEQLCQGLQQNVAAQRSMAAGAAPQNAAMAARNAAGNTARLGYGMSGQAATAGIDERMKASALYNDAIAKQRAMELQQALGSRQNATTAYQDVTPEGSKADKMAGAVGGGLGALFKVFSDERVKTDITDGEGKSRAILDGLKAYGYKYKDQNNGKGEQFGIMAQDLEKSGLGHAVDDTPRGKVVDGAKVATSALALTASLHKRLSKLEGK